VPRRFLTAFLTQKDRRRTSLAPSSLICCCVLAAANPRTRMNFRPPSHLLQINLPVQVAVLGWWSDVQILLCAFLPRQAKVVPFQALARASNARAQDLRSRFFWGRAQFQSLSAGHPWKQCLLQQQPDFSVHCPGLPMTDVSSCPLLSQHRNRWLSCAPKFVHPAMLVVVPHGLFCMSEIEPSVLLRLSHPCSICTCLSCISLICIFFADNVSRI